MRRAAVPTALSIAAALLVAGCGSTPDDELPAPKTTPDATTAAARAATPAGVVRTLAPSGARLGAIGRLADDAGFAVVQSRPDALLLLRPDGSLRARVALPGPARSRPLADRGSVLVGVGDGVVRIDPRTARVTGTTPGGADVLLRVATGLARVDARRGRLVVPGEGGGEPTQVAIPRDATDAVRVGEGSELAVLFGRRRDVRLYDATSGAQLGRAEAGTAPTAIASSGRWLWTTDSAGALLTFSVARREIELDRRVFLPDGPFALAVQGQDALEQERRRVQVVQTRAGLLAELTANGRPNELVHRPSVPDAVAVAALPRAVAVVSGRAVQVVRTPAVDPDQADDVPQA